MATSENTLAFDLLKEKVSICEKQVYCSRIRSCI